MNKKLENMTLKEVISHCASTICSKCAFFDEKLKALCDNGCCLQCTPAGWVFKDRKRKLCDEDLELLKLIKKLVPIAQGIYTTDVITSAYMGAGNVMFVPHKLFSPDIEDDSTIWFKDVEGME